MVKPICKDISCLVKCEDATPADRILLSNMFETFRDNKEELPYLSANMIGANKRIILLYWNMIDWILINPVIVEGEEPFEMGQECIYHKALRTAKRYKTIRVQYVNTNFEPMEKCFHNELSLMIQHMIDHIDGKLI